MYLLSQKYNQPFIKEWVVRLFLNPLTVGVVLALFVSPAECALLKPIVIGNINEPGLNPYQSDGTRISDSDFYTFQPVPPGKRLVVTNVTAKTCVIKSDWLIDAALVKETFPSGFISYLGPFGYQGAIGGNLFFGINQSVLVYYEPNEVPNAYVSSGGNNCLNANFTHMSISGYLVNLP